MSDWPNWEREEQGECNDPPKSSDWAPRYIPPGMLCPENLPKGYAEFEPDRDTSLAFWIGVGWTLDPPALPIHSHGEIRPRGSDIEIIWAIDGRRRVWMTPPLSGVLELAPLKALIDRAGSDAEKRHFQELLGLPVDEPSWMPLARAAGWSPA